MSREAWLAERRGGIGGTDAASILGVGFSTPYDVWFDKTHELPPRQPNDSMWWGSALEGVVAERYMIETGRRVWNPEQIFYHDGWPVLRGTPDRLVIGSERGVEIKTTSHHATGWGEPGTDQIPEGYLVQCSVYMAITKFATWDVPVLVGNSDFRIYTVRRDLTFEAWMLEKLREWWARYVDGDVAPPITGSQSTSEMLARAFPREIVEFVDATPEMEAIGTMIGSTRAELQRLQLQSDELENMMKALLGEAGGVATESFKVMWKAARDADKVNWQNVADYMIQMAGPHFNAMEIIAKFTEKKPGARRFTYTPLVLGETVAKAMKRLAG